MATRKKAKDKKLGNNIEVGTNEQSLIWLLISFYNFICDAIDKC